MTGRVAHIRRHPVKSHGSEPLAQVALTAGRTLPGDRRWAVAHEAARTDGTDWAPCANFTRGAKAPALMAVTSRLDEATGMVAFSHPDRPPITLDPDRDAQALLDWSRPLVPADRAASARVVRVAGRGMTDTAFPSISLINMATHREVEAHIGQPLDPRRWRCNFWLEGPPAWAEFDWIGHRLRLGTAILVVRERIGRCLATAANPDTGQRDVDTLGALQQGWSHKDFGIYAEVLTSGDAALDDTFEVIR